MSLSPAVSKQIVSQLREAASTLKGFSKVACSAGTKKIPVINLTKLRGLLNDRHNGQR